MHYTLHQLQIFLTISQHKSITKASEELHLTQPAVSIQLKKFQEQFSIPLTEVVGRQLYITDFGMEIPLIPSKVGIISGVFIGISIFLPVFPCTAGYRSKNGILTDSSHGFCFFVIP